MASLWDIAQTDQRYRRASDVQLPDGVELLSYDRGITHAQLKNGMKVAVVPCGKGGTMMMRRVCEGGSRLENEATAGVSHVLEHADFRSLDWPGFGAIDMNAATSKLFIEHQAYMLLDPATQHVQKTMQFQHDTMWGRNLNLSEDAIAREVNNVKDEGLFNGQYGMAPRQMIMAMEELLLPRVWTGGWVKPTIGLDQGQRISIRSAAELTDMHHALRGPSRTTLLLAGPIDTNRALHMANEVFSDVPDRRDRLLPLPTTCAPEPGPVALANVSTNSGKLGVCIGFIAPPFGRDTEVLSVMQHLVGVLGDQPGIKQHGVEDVSMYLNADKEGSVVSVLCKVKEVPGRSEEAALREGQHALEEHVLAPLRAFNSDGMLSELLRQYRATMHDTLQSGPQEVAALAMQGILMAGKPSLAWHVDERFADQHITSGRVREVANRIFDTRFMGIVRNTAYSSNQVLATSRPRLNEYVMSLMGNQYRPQQAAAFPTTCSLDHIGPDVAAGVGRPQYLAHPPSKIEHLDLNDRGKKVGGLAFNTVSVLPLAKKSVTAVFGNVSRYDGWAQAELVTAAMNAIAKATNASACKFKLEDDHITATVNLSSASPPGSYVQPLVTSVAMAAAISSGIAAGLAATLPQAALEGAVESVQDKYDSLAYIAQAQARSQVCSSTDAGYRPPDLGHALQQLYDMHRGVVGLLPRLYQAAPTLAGTNVQAADLYRVGALLLRVGSAESQHQALGQLAAAPVQPAREMTMVHAMDGLRTFPFMAVLRAHTPLRRADRAAFILSNQVMVGGMGSVFTHDLRQQGVSYRPAGGVKLSWQANPVLTLNATFDTSDMRAGSEQTIGHMERWRRGDSAVFSEKNVEQAKKSVLEMLRLRQMDFEAIKYDLLARLDPGKFGSDEFAQQVRLVDAAKVQRTMRMYFDADSVIQTSVVAADDRVLTTMA